MTDVSKITEFIDVNVPVRMAYDQWTQFEMFPRFMEGVDEVEQLDVDTLRWRAQVGGLTKEWTARITEQLPDKRIAWKSTDGVPNAGVVTFHRISDDASRVTLQLDYEPEGVIENVGDSLGVMQRRVRDDLERFKRFIESRGQATGAFRGAIASPDDARR